MIKKAKQRDVARKARGRLGQAAQIDLGGTNAAPLASIKRSLSFSRCHDSCLERLDFPRGTRAGSAVIC
jgi:hypothetical protein